MIRITTLLLFAFSAITTWSQLTIEDYKQADSVSKFSDLVYHEVLSVNWIDTTQVFWYDVRTPHGTRYYRVDASKQEKTDAFDHEKLCEIIESEMKVKLPVEKLSLKNLKFLADLQGFTFEKRDTVWKCNLADYSLERVSPIKIPDKRGYFGDSRDELSNDPVDSPDGKYIAFIRNCNVYVREKKGNNEQQLSFDGSEGDLYSSYIAWSPDSRYLATHKVRLNKKKYIHFVEAAPDSRLQPVLHKREYLKPGDALPIKRPALFNVEEGRQIMLDTSPFLNQFSLSNVKWLDDSSGFTFEFNQRGHQVYQVVRVDAEKGDMKVIIEERSNTFIDYSGKRFRHDLEKSGEIIWASERDGWNHLYLVDAQSGEVKNQITKGEWVVRGVEYVDEENREIIFRGSGRNRHEDPYFVHYYRVNFKGGKIEDLTPEKLQHEGVFSHDHKYFTDTYSSPDTPPVTVMRRASDGKELMVLGKADISAIKEKGWQAPEPFVAKARNGQTDIWGNIYRPTHFDPEKSYPIIEYIYAGPHGSFVEKSFRAYSGRFSGLAELGFIVVQIDGMGTSNRSKAFQDVCYKNLKDAGFPDRIKWIKAAARKYPYMDTTRVGIFGGSAGGQSAMAALLFHPDFYSAAVASCGCHDNRMDKIWWNEQWMGFPVGPHYAESSNVVNAHLLKGHLMLIVGELDDNVDPASTMQVADALIKAGKEFELVVLPGVNHTLGGKYGERKRQDFFVKKLLDVGSPEWNTMD